jgi:hypothetical protein
MIMSHNSLETAERHLEVAIENVSNAFNPDLPHEYGDTLRECCARYIEAYDDIVQAITENGGCLPDE